jgi:hypothetical protein
MISGQPSDLERNKSIIRAEALMSVIMPYIVPNSKICTGVIIIFCNIWYIVSDQTDFVRRLKAIPLQTWTGSEGFRRLKLPDFKTIGT